MARVGEIEHGIKIADRAEAVWNWSSTAGRVRARRRAQLIIAGGGLREGMQVLELGCGTGLFTESFAQTGCQITAIDVSRDLLELARQRTGCKFVRFLLEDAESLTLEDASFDAVVGSSVLHHLDLDRGLSEIRRVLRAGGRIAFAEPNMMNPQIALQRTVPLFRRWAGESPEETAFFRWSLRDKLRDLGFTEISIQPYDFLHPLVPAPLIGTVSRMGRIFEGLPGVREIAGSMIIRATR
jgi:ubiquinone/menaquinone biosynthesis C-methylase UbiE